MRAPARRVGRRSGGQALRRATRSGDRKGDRLRHSDALAGRFEPHPETPGAWLLDLDGERPAVTFDPHTYQNTPGLEFCTWATPLLETLLNHLAPALP